MLLHRFILNTPPQTYRHIVAALDPAGGMRERFRLAGVELYIFDVKHKPFCEFFRLVKLIRSLRPAIVQTWLYHADLLGGLAAQIAGCRRVVWGIRTTDVANRGSRSIATVRTICAMLSHWLPQTIVCNAEAVRRSHIEVGYSAMRMVVIPNGFDMTLLKAGAAEVEALRQNCGFTPQTQVIGMLGRFNPAKNQQDFVRAAGILVRQHPKLRFLMVGRDCIAGNSTLMAWIEATGAPECFVLLGERSDVSVCLAAMDYFALPSRTEGFPNVLAEAMAMKRPSVATDVGDAGMLLSDCGVLVPPEDAAALATGLSHLLALKPKERIELGNRAHSRIKQEFSMTHLFQRFSNVYLQILKINSK